MSFSFPYPTQGTARPSGQGCLSCVHKPYCEAFYYFKRYGVEGRTIDDATGRACNSWSSNIADIVKTTPTQDDLDEVEYIYDQGTGSEADRCGMTDLVTASNRGM